MRVLVAAAHRSVVGGAETYLRAVLPHLLSRGIELGLVTANPPAPGRPAIDDHCPGLPTWVAADPKGVLAVGATWRPDVVYTHEMPDPAADAALVARFPTVLYAHNYGGACVSGTKCHAFPAKQTCSRRLGPACLGLYSLRRCGGRNPLTALSLYRTNRRRQHLLPQYRAVLVASRHMVAELTRNGTPADRVVLNPYFPPEARPDPDPPTPKPRTDRVLFVGRLTALKGWRELLTALHCATGTLGRRLTLVVAGDGPDLGEFEAKARERDVPAEFLGWVGSNRREAEMRAADVLAVPSVWPEPFGIVGIEAGCVGLPAVGFAVGGIPDWLAPGTSGELAPGDPPTPQGLAAALVRALSNPAHLTRLSRGAWAMAGQFTLERHLTVLEKVLALA
jgi:glycosyltransferase involved in cell wall biosynthesis